MARLLRIDGMLSRTETIDRFHVKLSRTEKELYEEFLKTEACSQLSWSLFLPPNSVPDLRPPTLFSQDRHRFR